MRTALLKFIALLAACCLAPAAMAAVSPGDTPPASLGSTLARDDVHVTDYAGKVLVVTFWASWCGPCARELPMLEGLQRAAAGRVQVVAVNIEDYDRFRVVARKLKPLALTITHDDFERSADAYGVRGIPHLVLIGRDGKVIRVHRGYSEDSFDAILAEINAELATPAPAAKGNNPL